MEFDSIITKAAEEIRSGKCDNGNKLYLILQDIESLSIDDQKQYANHITKIKQVILSFPDTIELLTRQDRDQLAFPFEWRIHERLNTVSVNITSYDGINLLKASMKLLIKLDTPATDHIKNYLIIADNAVKNDSMKYQLFHEDLMKTLDQQGWIIDFGFRKEPKIKHLITDLKWLFDKYLM